MEFMSLRSLCFTTSATIAALTFFAGNASTASIGYTQTNLVSDIPGLAANTDPNLVNPWGISFSPMSPFWVSDNGKGVATLYDSSGTPLPLVVSIPAPGGGRRRADRSGLQRHGRLSVTISSCSLPKTER